ncbi:hypothetical protein [Desulfatiferula olefinivorans]
MDSKGNDAVNDLSMIVLEVTNALRMRGPNYHARIYDGSPWAGASPPPRRPWSTCTFWWIWP